MPPLPPADLDHILAHTQGLWEELRDGRIFITGGTGFFGCWLLESFAWANEKLKLNATATVLTRNPSAFQKKIPHLASAPCVQMHAGDVRSFPFPEGRFSHVIHAATPASARLNEEDPLEMLDTIVTGTRRALDFAVACGAKKFLLTSSGAVYGRQPLDMPHIPEGYSGAPDPTDPRSAYGEGKRMAELLCAIHHPKHGLETKIARCFAFVGPHLPLDTHFAIGNFIRDALRGGPIQINGDGTSHRSYLYAADLAIWLWTILVRGQSCRPYNVGSDESHAILDVARTVAEVIQAPASIVRTAQTPVPGDRPARYVPAVQRARSELGLSVFIGLTDAVARTLDFHRHGSR